MPSFHVAILVTLLGIVTVNSQSNTDNETACFQVIDAYSNDSSTLYTLCVDRSKFDIQEVEQTCSDCDNSFYGTIGAALDLNYLWVLIAGCLVFFMQTGFTMLEAGSVKIGNVQNILFKNMMDACVGAISFYLFGFAVAYGDGECSIGGFMGCNNAALSSTPVDWNSFFFQWAFAATSATIVSGSVAERCSLTGYFLYTTILTIWVYPVVVHWFWSGAGWLSAFNDDAYFPGGVIDFAGSGVVHMVGGWSGLMGAVMLGPRLNRFKYDDMNDNKDKRNDKQIKEDWRALQLQHTLGNSVPFQVLGTFILWFGWYGFNPGSTLAANGAMDIASKAAVTSTLAAAGGGIVSASIGRVFEGYFSLPRVCNGILAGLVAITAGCSVVDTGDALAIGIIGAFVYYSASTFLERIKVDDPLDAWAVHGCSGAWGVISIGFFASDENIAFAGYNDILVKASKGYRLSLQIFAVFIIIVWVTACIGTLFYALNRFGVLRVSAEVERKGLDAHDHGGVAIDYKQGYIVADQALARASTVFGLTGLNTDESEEDEMKEGVGLETGNVNEDEQKPAYKVNVELVDSPGDNDNGDNQNKDENALKTIDSKDDKKGKQPNKMIKDLSTEL